MVFPPALLCGLALVSSAGTPRPANAVNTTVYALRPLDLVDITDKDSADAPGDIFFWLKDHIIKPLHCRVEPTWHQCSEAGTIDVDMVYQEFVVEHDSTAVGVYESCNPDHTDPSGKTWECNAHGSHNGSKPNIQSFGAESIAGHAYPQFKGDPTPALTAKFLPGNWYSTTHDGECGNPHANASKPCTWLQHRGKIANATCVNNRVLDVALKPVSADVKACEQEAAKKCDYINAVQTNLTDCCIFALVKGVNATARADLVGPFIAAFNSDDPSQGGCPAL